MVNSKPVKVSCYSGYKADEIPRTFIWKLIPFEILEIMDRWYEGYNKPGQSTVYYFRVRTEPSGIYVLKHHLHSDNWFLVL